MYWLQLKYLDQITAGIVEDRHERTFSLSGRHGEDHTQGFHALKFCLHILNGEGCERNALLEEGGVSSGVGNPLLGN